MSRTIHFYNDHAHLLFERDLNLSFEQVHAPWLHLLPETPGLALDVGAGSGRDAVALAAGGWEVYAVEPSPARRRLAATRARAMTLEGHVHWLDDAMPALSRLEKSDLAGRFDLILASAVWMHVAPTERPRAFRKLVQHLKPGGLLVLSLRRGPAPPGRGDYDVDIDELSQLAVQHAVELITPAPAANSDLLGRDEVSWTTLIMRAPDDGTGAFSLLRHIILNDAKSSTYKLALLRTLIRIADGAAGMVIRRDEAHVTLPFGLVALIWVQLLAPLLRANLRQQPAGNNKLSFVSAHWRHLMETLPHNDLRLGRRFSGDVARALTGALRDVRNTIRNMPARYTTFSDGQPVFLADSAPFRLRDRFSLDSEALAAMGTFSVPTHIWDSMRRHACWIEPAINLEWARLMQRYDPECTLDDCLGALAIELTEHDTSFVRQRALELGQNTDLHCVWTNQRLRQQFHIDHSLPFARWPNNDLWNLLPTSPAVNTSKNDRLPSAKHLEQAYDRIMRWWQLAYDDSPGMRHRFMTEAAASLPNGRCQHDFEAVFEGMWLQRLRLQIDQQIPEWSFTLPQTA